MVLTSRTGLVEGIRRPIQRRVKPHPTSLVFSGFSRPASFSLRPFAGLYNPFSPNCSVLCNHPADSGARYLLQHAKNTWASDHKGHHLPAELEAIRTGLMRDSKYIDELTPISEELYRRYTNSETDSRPVTPAPTLASRGSQKRRCMTPDPGGNNRENRPTLILDLRRSQSQETLTTLPMPGGKSRRMTKNTDSLSDRTNKSSRSALAEDSPTLLGPQLADNDSAIAALNAVAETGRESDSDAEEIKRRGKRRKRLGKKQGGSELEKEFQGLKEPGETQMSTLGNSSRRPSASIAVPVPGSRVPSASGVSTTPDSNPKKPVRPVKNFRSFLSSGIIKQLQRELDQETIDAEFDKKRRIALEEAKRARDALGVLYPPSPELRRFRREMAAAERSPEDTDVVLSIPRNFSRQSARFELPFDTDSLATLTPMDYIGEYVRLSSGRKMLYNQIFNKHQYQDEIEENGEKETGKEKSKIRCIKEEYLSAALSEVVGHKLSEEHMKELQSILSWTSKVPLDFRTWCGVAASCERILGPQFATSETHTDDCLELEKADFESLPRKLDRLKERGLDPDPRLVKLLFAIRNETNQNEENVEEILEK